MPSSATASLRALEGLKSEYGGAATERRLALLRHLASAALPSARAVVRLHEQLCFLRAYPDDARVLSFVQGMLARFASRRDLRRHRAELADSGIAGTDVSYRFYERTAQWLAGHWGDRLTIDWDEFEQAERIDRLLHLLALYTETPGLDEHGFEVREWIDRLRGSGETDATFLLRRFAALPMDAAVRQTLYDELDVPLRLAAGPGTPSRTLAFAPQAARTIAWQTGPLQRTRPIMRKVVYERPRAVRAVGPAAGRALIDLARGAMVTRARDLDVFAYGDPRDVRLIDWGGGLQFAAIGFVPERRLLLEAVYGFLTLKNGVPVGYTLNSALFGSAEIAYNVFETFRGGEAALIYGRLLASVRHLFSVDTFTIYPYQLGQDNEEALGSGAWWFYQKLGFRARDASVLRLMERELARMRRDEAHRSSIATLRRLADVNVYLDLGALRDDVIGIVPLGDIGLRVTDYLARRFGSREDRGRRACARDAARRFALRSFSGWTHGERLAWERWAPLLLLLPGVGRWSRTQRAGAVCAVRAKGGRRESDFVRLFDRHTALRRALLQVAKGATA